MSPFRLADEGPLATTKMDHGARMLDQFQDPAEERAAMGAVLPGNPDKLGKDSGKFRSSRPLSNGIFMQTNLSAANLNRICIQVTEAAGLSAEEWKVECAS
jgi:hypothetical protein